MSLAFGLAHPHWFQLSGKFNPLSLFSAGEQGIAVPDLTPGNGFLFQDSAGTTPVTAYEQPVGLILDRSKGLVLGADVLGGAGSFSSATGWTQGTGWSIGSGVATATAGFGTTLSYPATLTVGSIYRIDVQASSVTGGTLTMQLRGGTIVGAPSITADGTYTFYLTAVTGNNSVGCTKSPTFAGVVDNFIVRELPGNHLIQATSTKRPTLSARYNLLTYTEQFDNGVWVKGNVSGDITLTTGQQDPLGGTTATSFQLNVASANFIYQNVGTLGGAVYTASCYLKQGTARYGYIILVIGANRYAVLIDLQTGSFISEHNTSTPLSSKSYSISPAGNGYWRLSVSGANTGGGTGYIVVEQSTTSAITVNSVLDITNSGTGGILLWGADLRRTIDTIGQPAYQRVGASNDYDTAGFFPYLSFDGTDDSMATAASVNFTGTNKMTVFSGVTKNSDAVGAHILFETSSDPDVNNGTFVAVGVNNFAGTKYAFASRGTTLRVADTTSATYSAPVTNVFTGIGDISGDVAALRLNGSAISTNTGDQGTGNFGNYPLFIGARNNASLFLNGRLYPFFIRGAATDAGLIAQVEQYIRARMPVSF